MPLRKTTGQAAYHVLTDEEQQNPQMAIDEFFDFVHLHEARELLWTWLRVTVAGNYHKELNTGERAVLLSFYEKTGKLLEAAHAIQQQYRKEDPLASQ